MEFWCSCVYDDVELQGKQAKSKNLRHKRESNPVLPKFNRWQHQKSVTVNWDNIYIGQITKACSSYGCFILRATRLSNKLLEQGYVKERLKSSLRKSYGRYGDLIKQYEVSLSQMLNDILWPDHIQWQPPTDQTLYRTRPLTEIWVVSIEHLRQVWHADRGRLLLRTPGPVPLGLAYVLRVETNPFPNLSLFYRTMLFEYPSVLSPFCLVRDKDEMTFYVMPIYICQISFGICWQSMVPLVDMLAGRFTFCRYVLFVVSRYGHPVLPSICSHLAWTITS